MSKPINNETLKEFLKHQIEIDDIEDFGYLIIPSDEILNDEALSYLKEKFKEFVES